MSILAPSPDEYPDDYNPSARLEAPSPPKPNPVVRSDLGLRSVFCAYPPFCGAIPVYFGDVPLCEEHWSEARRWCSEATPPIPPSEANVLLFLGGVSE